MNRQELIDAMKKLDDAKPCPIHGRAFLEICDKCLEDVRCSECNLQSCQCWNDE